ncbi:MAG: Rpn family recombination-promoting nuclease/putative transposase [Myxococcota bacterium]|jgi:hypothetical protein|nr:Rpn family recombination-promoting nuclease/putative transposase [Myxococcota bacterium]
MPTPHDALFKAFFSDPVHAVDVLRSALPGALSARIEWASLEVVPGSFVDDELRERQSDLPFRANLDFAHEPSDDDASIWLHVLFEHQSTEDPRMVFRMLRYMVRIWERAESERLPPIVAVVLHHSPKGWRVARRFSEIVAPYDPDLADFVPGFEIVVDDVSSMPDEALARRLEHAAVQLVLRVLRDGRATNDPAAWMLGVRDLIEQVRRATSDVEVLWLVIRYLWEVSRVEDPGPFLDAVRTTMGEPMGERATTLAESVLRRGVQQGLEQGLSRGRAAMLLHLMEQKFGALDESVRARVLHAADVDLEGWADRLFVATTVEALFGE